MRRAPEIPIETLRAHIGYNPETGILNWKIPRRGRDPYRAVGSPMRGAGYLVFGMFGSMYRAHRVAWALHYGEWPAEEVDHKNLNRQDNRITNLRVGSHHLNQGNSPPHRKSGLKGTCRRGSRWSAQIGVKMKTVWLGTFATEEEAHEAYQAAAVKYFGEYARFEGAE